MLLSNDATALILTPIVYSLVTRLRLPVLPYLFACTFIAETASLLNTGQQISWSIFGFIAGMFIVVQAVEGTGLTAQFGQFLLRLSWRDSIM